MKMKMVARMLRISDSLFDKCKDDAGICEQIHFKTFFTVCNALQMKINLDIKSNSVLIVFISCISLRSFSKL